MEIKLTHLLLMNISSALEPRVSPEWTDPSHRQNGHVDSEDKYM